VANGRKTGGRRKGTPNKGKRGFREALRAYCAQLGVDPHRFMAEMMVNDELVPIGVSLTGEPILAPAVSATLKLHAARELAQYLEPKLKAIEHSGDVDKPVAVVIRRAHRNRD
jgi:hypothetical protein